MRNKKISADISAEAKSLLDELCEKHSRSKGFLLEKMILKFCAPEPTTANIATVEKPKRKVFKPPLLESIYEYMKERGVDDIGEASKFNDFYESKGWLVGRVKMKCWKAAVRNWLKSSTPKQAENILEKSAKSDWHLKEQGF